MSRAPVYARLRRALDAGQLREAERAARELDRVSLEDALRLVLLLLTAHDYRYEPAAVKWLGRILSEQPRLFGLRGVAEIATCLEALDGASANVARSQLAVLLRHAGLEDSARLLERPQR
ncbi:MAG: hypothetical protein K0R88_2727 [Solirubrobacterales bacterium]|jgi:hypothetical protein|nr:hypothetical protein [Solirubrobacterales bacterium]